MDIEIKQAKTSDFKLGLEKEGLSHFVNTSSSYEIPYIKGKFRADLTEEQIKIIEDHYGYTWNGKTQEDFDFWSTLNLPPLKHRMAGFSVTEPQDMILVGVLKYMGIAAPSLIASDNAMGNYKFVIHNKAEEEEYKATIHESRHEAIASLYKIKEQEKFLKALCKHLLPTTSTIKMTKKKAYNLLSEYVEGKHGKAGDSLIRFNKAMKMDKSLLYVTVDFKDAFTKNIIRKNDRNMFYNASSNTEYGKNETEAIAYLMDPKNQDELGTGSPDDKSYSIRKQLQLLEY